MMGCCWGMTAIRLPFCAGLQLVLEVVTLDAPFLASSASPTSEDDSVCSLNPGMCQGELRIQKKPQAAITVGPAGKRSHLQK